MTKILTMTEILMNLYNKYNLETDNEYKLLNRISTNNDLNSLKEWCQYGNIYILLEKDIDINSFFKLYISCNLKNKIIETILELRKNDICNIHIEDCQICLNKKYKNIWILSCNHSFHTKCIKKWLFEYKQKNCPICRNQINK